MEELLELEFVRRSIRLTSSGYQGGESKRRTQSSRYASCYYFLACILSLTRLSLSGFNYAYRRSATAASPAPNSANANLSANANVNVGISHSAPPTKISTPAPQPDVANAKSLDSSPSPSYVPKDTSSKPNGTPSNEKGEKEKAKRKDKRKERAERDTKDKDKESKEGGNGDVTPASEQEAQLLQPEASTSEDADQLKSPATDSASTGVRTPTSKRPARNPWTIFMRMAVPADEPEVREFFGEAKDGVRRSHH
jgi:cytoskeletal protein RodZ